MAELHDFSNPRNLYEKLIRDGEKLNVEVNGDNVFNFVSSAFHLQHWIKNSPLIGSEVMKRILKRISSDESIKLCESIARAKQSFMVELDENGSRIIVGDLSIDVFEMRNHIINQYDSYFKSK
ncbi:MAG: hypothetical protein CVV23_08405 [Ignavibacteriae bacterium HGW-Ignavibacteriae-2]|jgi:hypothetical protein|nr:hypothetical protein [Bacteroidota bacterium]PKL88824.1 MAG: hypothetical protein CVV23_08405 [Ignavibacteriae bacterium HGW-Ignavibacteriae-2]